MNYLITILCLVITPVMGFTQNYVLQDSLFPNENQLQEPSSDLLFLFRQSLEKKFEAPLFLLEDWTNSVLVDDSNNAYKIKSRYKVQGDEMQVQFENKTKVLFPQKIKAIRIGQMIFVPVTFETQGFETYGYFQVLSDGKVMLLKRFEVSGGKIVERLYSKAENEPAKRLKRNKNCILDVLKDKKTKVRAFAKKERTVFGDEKDLIRIFDFYNQL